MNNTPVLIILLFISVNAFAQKPAKHKKHNTEKMDALKMAHITNELNLTETESQAFWPIYNENENRRKQLRESKKSSFNHKKIMDLTDSEAESHLNKLMELEQQKEKNERSYLKKLTKALPAKKILLLKKADRSFRRKVLEQLKHKRNNKPGKRKH